MSLRQRLKKGFILTTKTRPQNRKVRYCNPNCQFFKCSKRAMGPTRKIRGRTRISCNFVQGDLCTGSKCTYSFCQKRKMLSDGTCGLRERSGGKETDDKIEAKYEKELIKKDQQSSQYTSLMKDKYRKKLKGKKW